MVVERGRKRTVKSSEKRAASSSRKRVGTGSAQSEKNEHTATQKKGQSSSSRPRSASTIRSVSRAPAPITKSFLAGTWWAFCIQNWILDFGRPIAMDLVPTSWSPLSLPGVGDYFHMLYNVLTPFLLLQVIDRSPRRVPDWAKYLVTIFFVMGASMHLVADSVNHRLRHYGYQNHLTVRENPIMQELRPAGLIQSFELLYFFDERLGHLMWYIPFFAASVACYWGSIVAAPSAAAGGAGHPSAREPLPTSAALILAPASALYMWYLATEGQITPLLVASVAAMLAISATAGPGRAVGVNGRFLLYTFGGALALVAAWSYALSDNAALRERYPSWFYVPEPWSWWSLREAERLASN